MNSRFPFILILISIFASPLLARDDDDDADSRQEMRDFLGGVYRGHSAMAITRDGLALGSEGVIIRTGSTITTPRGVYVKCGDTWLLPDGEGAVVSTGKTFLSPKGAVVKTGNTYLSSEGNAVSTGHTVLRNFDDDSE